MSVEMIRLFIAVVFVLWATVESANITLVTIATGDAGRNGFIVADPEYDVLIALIKESDPVLFSNFTHISLRYYNSSEFDRRLASQQAPNTDCQFGADHVTEMLSKFYFTHDYLFSRPLNEQFTILNTDDCHDVALQIANFASATSTFLGMHATTMELSNNTAFPTTMNLFAMPDDYFAYTLGFVAAKFGWTEFNVIHLQNDPNGYFYDQRTDFLLWLKDKDLAVDFFAIPQNTSLDDFSGSHLDRTWTAVASKRGYTYDVISYVQENDQFFMVVSVILLQPDMMRQFMIEAHVRNLTNGDFVFVAFGIRGVPSRDEVFWTNGDFNDQQALAAFRALIIIMDGSADWDGAAVLSQRIRDEYMRRYNWTLAAQDLAIVDPIRANEWIQVFVQTYMRLLPRLATTSVQEFVRTAANRTYDLPSRSFYLDQNGKMIVPVPITRLDTNGKFQTIMTFDTEKLVLRLPQSSLDWFGNDSLPGDLPECGLHGEKCLSQQSRELISIVVPVIFVLLVAVFILIGCFIRHKSSNAHIAHLILPHDEVKETLRDADHLTHDQSPDADGHTQTDKDSLLGFPARFRERNVLVIPLNPTGIQKGKKMKHTHGTAFLTEVLAVSRVRHQYIAEFYGLLLSPTSSQLVYERPANGSIRTITEKSTIFRDNEIRLTLMVNIIQGLHFIHTSDLRYHGNLSSDVCLLNDRYTIRIAQAGFSHLAAVLGSAKSSKREIAHRHQADDILAFGHVLLDIFGTENRSSTDNRSAKSLQDIIASCLNPDPHHRPTTNNLKNWTQKLGLSGRNIVELLLHRLQKHAEYLEEEVAARSADLLEERRKLDDLLQEMLPSLIISQLRNNQTIKAEMFDSATVLFSDIPVFSRLVAECGPLDVIAFLGQIHTAFDKVVHDFDAYKVETINDSYVVVSGLPLRNEKNHAPEICRLALKLRTAGDSMTIPSWGSISPCPRFGINSGSLAAGVVGSRMPRYCLFGDTMNTASRMESHGAANKIHVSGTTRDLVDQSFPGSGLTFVSRGYTTIKGKGSVETFWLKNALHASLDN